MNEITLCEHQEKDFDKTRTHTLNYTSNSAQKLQVSDPSKLQSGLTLLKYKGEVFEYCHKK